MTPIRSSSSSTATLYNSEDELADDAGAVDISTAAVRRPGDDVTIVAYGGTLRTALGAAEELPPTGSPPRCSTFAACAHSTRRPS